MKTKRITLAFLALLLAAATCAAFPTGGDQPARVETSAPVQARAYPPPPVFAAYPPPVEDDDPEPATTYPPTATEYVKDPGERGPDDPTPLPTREMFIGLPYQP